MDEDEAEWVAGPYDDDVDHDEEGAYGVEAMCRLVAALHAKATMPTALELVTKVWYIVRFSLVFPEVFFRSRVIRACPVTMGLIMAVMSSCANNNMQTYLFHSLQGARHYYVYIAALHAKAPMPTALEIVTKVCMYERLVLSIISQVKATKRP